MSARGAAAQLTKSPSSREGHRGKPLPPTKHVLHTLDQGRVPEGHAASQGRTVESGCRPIPEASGPEAGFTFNLPGADEGHWPTLSSPSRRFCTPGGMWRSFCWTQGPGAGSRTERCSPTFPKLGSMRLAFLFIFFSCTRSEAIIWTLLFERQLEHYRLYNIEKIQFFIV